MIRAWSVFSCSVPTVTRHVQTHGRSCYPDAVTKTHRFSTDADRIFVIDFDFRKSSNIWKSSSLGRHVLIQTPALIFATTFLRLKMTSVTGSTLPDLHKYKLYQKEAASLIKGVISSKVLFQSDECIFYRQQWISGKGRREKPTKCMCKKCRSVNKRSNLQETGWHLIVQHQKSRSACRKVQCHNIWRQDYTQKDAKNPKAEEKYNSST